MKNKFIKILLLALALITIFGSVTPMAYESYDTYTYSIDGEALPSPHAYTPDVETYDSTSMGLLAGYYWCYDGDKVAIWNGEMSAEKTSDTYSEEAISFVWNEETSSYIAEKLAKDYIANYGEDSEEVNLGYIKIPEIYDDGIHGEAPVTAIADGFISTQGWADENVQKNAAKIYKGVYSIIIGKNVK